MSFGLSTLAGFAGSLIGGQLPRLMSNTFALTPDSAPRTGRATRRSTQLASEVLSRQELSLLA
jgi:hypothetical protein